IADAGIDVAEGLQAEQGSGMVDVLEHEGRRLIDRRRTRAGSRIGLRAGVDRERGKAWDAVGHGPSFSKMLCVRAAPTHCYMLSSIFWACIAASVEPPATVSRLSAMR